MAGELDLAAQGFDPGAPDGVIGMGTRKALRAWLEPPMLDHFAAPWVARDRYELRADARRFETWENNYAARLGLGEAIDYALGIGLEAIEAMRSRAYDVVLMDMRMPAMSGLEALQAMGRAGTLPPTIILTTFDDDQLVLAGIKAGAKGYITKGAPLDEMVNQIRSKTRAKVEHCFGVIKCIFGWRKVSYKGLAKNANRLMTTAALCNLYMVRGKLAR